jgi:excinuclease ABC subunit C
MTRDRLSHLPQRPGVYIFKDHKDKVIYVGKAKNLRNRLRTYFQKSSGLDQRKASMVTLIKDFSYIVTENELEALILESNLIKQYKPRFNIVLRDDKNYPYLKLTLAEKWPRLLVVRRITKDGSLYFGPYVPAQSMWDALAFIRRNFPIRICNYALEKPMRPCIQYQMGRCPAPCAERISREDYLKIVKEVRLFLSGKRGELLEDLERTMLALSDELKFEEAARIRDRISHIRHVWDSQRVIAPELGDMDVIGFSTDKADAAGNVFFIRNGILIGVKDFFFRDIGEASREEFLNSFITLFYAKEIIPPEEIIVASKPGDLRNITTWLSEKRDGKVRIVVPHKGKRAELLRMADENAEQTLRNRKDLKGDERLKTMQERLHLQYLPHTIGAFDVSTTSGTESVGAFVCWQENEFMKESYRHVRIKGVPGVDDYAMMAELITRTLGNLAEKIPDLIVIDGGKGHLEIARDVVEAGGITLSDGRQPMLIAVAKGPDRAYTLSSDIISLEDGRPWSLLLKGIRDEVHRFAVTFHRKLRDKRLMKSPLEEISGIGKKRRFELLRFFGSIEAIRKASVEEIAGMKGFNRKVAETIVRELRRQQ